MAGGRVSSLRYLSGAADGSGAITILIPGQSVRYEYERLGPGGRAVTADKQSVEASS